jgi:hypothetical protein
LANSKKAIERIDGIDKPLMEEEHRFAKARERLLDKTPSKDIKESLGQE